MKSVFTLPDIKRCLFRRPPGRSKPAAPRLASACLFALACVFVLAGCGGGSGSAGSAGTAVSTSQTGKKTGGVTVKIVWPNDPSKLVHALSRYIPLNAQSVRITLTGTAPGNSTPQTWAIVYSDRPAASPADPNQQASRTPTTTENIDYLPVISLNVQVDAFDVSSTAVKQGQGTKLATASDSLVIFADQRVPFTFTLASTIQNIKITPANPATDINALLLVNTPISYKATAYDTGGAVVPLAPNTLAWASTAPGVLDPTVDYDPTTGFATFTPRRFGVTKVTVTDQGSRVSSTLQVTVQGSVSIAPDTATVGLYTPQVFTANVVGSTNQRVNWTIIHSDGTPDSSGGSLSVVNNDGVNPSQERYTPPRTPGTYYLQAVSQEDPNQPAGKAKIIVQGGYGQITVTNN